MAADSSREELPEARGKAPGESGRVKRKRKSVGRVVIARLWMLIVAVVVVAVAGFAVYRLHGIFGTHVNTATPGGGADQFAPFNPKSVVLEVFGEPGATARISYTDVHAQPQLIDSAPLPWSYEDSTTTPAVITNIMAQSSGSYLGCRITIDGEVKVEKVVEAPGPYTYCLDKSG